MIDYVIISSDDNHTYKDFYPIVSKRWFDLGFKTYYINITDTNSIEETEYGVVHKIKSLDFVTTSFQAQVVRLYSANFIDGVILTSDIDMLPINGGYFHDQILDYQEEKIVICSGQPYESTPYYPMCYVLGHTKTFRKFLEIENDNFHSYCEKLLSYGQSWCTDENFMYDKFQNHLSNLVVKNDRDFKRRVDRGDWNYNVELLKSGHYIDSHMLRPYKNYKNKIDTLISNF